MQYFGLIIKFIIDTFKTKAMLVIDNLALRQQLADFTQQEKRPTD
jgi:hypothetical protein